MEPTRLELVSGSSNNATLSSDGLTYQTALYYSNRVQSRDGMLSGRWYWELRGDSLPAAMPNLGVDASGAQEAGLVRLNNVAPVATGDVLGFAIDVDNGTFTITKNGVSVFQATGLTRDPGAAWRFQLEDGGASSSKPTRWIANFGQSAFAYPVPSGYSPGPVREALTVAGIEAAGLGTVGFSYPPVVQGLAAGELGQVARVTRVPVVGLDVSAGLGAVGLRFDQTVQVAGLETGQLGMPSFVPPAVVADPSARFPVEGLMAVGLGDVGVSLSAAVAVDGLQTTEIGGIRAGLGFGVQGIAAGAFGEVIAGAAFVVEALARGVECGAPAASLGFPVEGLQLGALGDILVRKKNVVYVAGLEVGALGQPGVARTFPVAAMPARLLMGRPVLRNLAC